MAAEYSDHLVQDEGWAERHNSGATTEYLQETKGRQWEKSQGPWCKTEAAERWGLEQRTVSAASGRVRE